MVTSPHAGPDAGPVQTTSTKPREAGL